MSLFDTNKNKNQISIQRLLSVDEVTNYSVKSEKNGELIFIIIKPTNLSVLSPLAIHTKIMNFTSFLSSNQEVEIVCINNAESFSENKRYILKRIDEEENTKVKEVLQQEFEFLDKIQIDIATSRAFLVCLRIKLDEKKERRKQIISKLEKALRECHFEAYRLPKSALQRLLAIYFINDKITETFQDFDGQLYADKIDEKKLQEELDKISMKGSIEDEEETEQVEI